MKRPVALLVVALILDGCSTPDSAPTQPPPTRNIDEFFSAFTDEWVRANPNLARSSRYFTGAEQDRLERELSPETRDYQHQRVELAKRGLEELRKYDRDQLTETQRLSMDVMEWQLDMVVRDEQFLDYTFPIQQMNGANVNLLETLTVRHPVNSERDAENYVAALGQVSTRLDEAIKEHQGIDARGIIPPTFILKATIKQLQGFVDTAVPQNPFVLVFSQKMEDVSDIPAHRRHELRAEAEKIVSSRIYPAWKRAIAVLQAQLPRSSDEAGISQYKGGAEAYEHFLRRFTTTELTAEQIHEIGLREVALIEEKMDAILRTLGRTTGSVKERIEKLSQDLQYAKPTSEPSRAQIMRDIDVFIRDAEKRAELLFDIRPKSPVIAQPFPSFREANAAASYNAPPVDGSRPGIYQYPRRLSNMTKFGLKSVTYHEAVPGHHFDISLQVENKALPRFRQIRAFGGISSRTEGWALYAENLAAESGWYDGDPEGLLGQLEAALFRARRLVVDTGLLAKHWTRQQAIDFGIEASEVERYVVYPGQACSYMIGKLKLVELREKAKTALGDKFSLRDYHNLILQTGSVPLNLLEREVEHWIRSRDASAP
jgi:uncharacterized protein (DUF885 family)